jgi:hypothetical protein
MSGETQPLTKGMSGETQPLTAIYGKHGNHMKNVRPERAHAVRGEPGPSNPRPLLTTPVWQNSRAVARVHARAQVGTRDANSGGQGVCIPRPLASRLRPLSLTIPSHFTLHLHAI